MTPFGSAGYLSGTMTLLHDAVEAKKFDVRVVERQLDRGVVQQKDREKFLKELPDDAANAEYVSIEAIASEGESNSSA